MSSSKYFFLILSALLLGFTTATAQSTEVDGLISELYSSITFDENSDPDYDTFQSLFIEDGRLISVHDTTSYHLTPASYKQSMNSRRQNGKILAFEEKELHRETDRFGNIMHVFSTYQTHVVTPEGEDSQRGSNSLQLMKENGRWKVVSIIWYEEKPGTPLPDEYLKRQDD